MIINRRRAPIPTCLSLLRSPSEGRADVERFIQVCFARAWGAQVTEFLPWLAALRDDSGELLGAMGMRQAEMGPLFLEQYLDAPVEGVLSARAGAPVGRGGIAEVGNLTAMVPGGGRWLMTAMTGCLHAAGREWVVFTGGAELQNACHRLGLYPLVLGPADPARLMPSDTDWGRYYDQRPVVMAGRVSEAFEVLSELFSVECALHALWDAAGRVGAEF